MLKINAIFFATIKLLSTNSQTKDMTQCKLEYAINISSLKDPWWLSGLSHRKVEIDKSILWTNEHVYVKFSTSPIAFTKTTETNSLQQEKYTTSTHIETTYY